MERPTGSNADEWALWLEEWTDLGSVAPPEGGPDGCAFVAVQVCEAIEAATKNANEALWMIATGVSDMGAEHMIECMRAFARQGLGDAWAEYQRKFRNAQH